MKVLAAVIAVAAGEKINVAQTCRAAGVSRKTFYKWVARCRETGATELGPRSRRPHHSPGQTGAVVEELVVRLRKELAETGLDHGATTIQWHLGRHQPRLVRVPSTATVHRILVRRGLVVPQPEKRPKSSYRRFEAPAPNELWQIDYFDWGIGTGLVKVFNTLDDHSRLAVRSRAVLEATGEEAWTTFTQAAATWGLPAGVLSDNGLCFSGKLRGFEVLFEARLRDLGVRPITGRPYHPQTTGKVERFQQTVKKWLRRQPLAADLEQLQAQLDTFLPIYNNERPHQGIGRVTPISRWQAATPVTPPAEPLPHPYGRPGAHLGTVNNSGVLRLEQLSIGLGVEWAGCAATAFIDETHATVFIDGQLVRHLTIDRNRYYQPTRRRRGGPRRPRHLPS